MRPSPVSLTATAVAARAGTPCPQHSLDMAILILKRDEPDPHGRFAWILDPDGTMIELWQPTVP